MAIQSKYAVVDTTLSITDSTPIPGLNGRQGDSGRIVYFALKDGRLPHNLDGQDVTLEVKDAAGKIKVVNGIYDMISATAGLFSMLIPAEVYQAAGDVEEAFLVVTDQQNLVISSIPITFTVFANGIIVSANTSREYVASVEEMISDAKDKIENVQQAIDDQALAYNSLKSAVDNTVSMIQANQVATLSGNNILTGPNKFTQPITGNLSGNAASADKATKNALPFKYKVAVDLNVLPSASEIYTSSAYYFSSPTSVANTPNNLNYGLVETFVLTDSSILQRFTQPQADSFHIWTRLIKGWKSETVSYGTWISEQDMHHTTINAFGGTLDFYRIGNTVTVAGGTTNATFKFNDFSVIYDGGTIPAGYCPATNYSGIVLETPTWLEGSQRKNGVIQFGPSGWINSRSAYIKDDLSTWISVAGTYVTNDSMPN